MSLQQKEGCVFCQIISKDEPATIHYEDDEIIVIVNRLQWVPVMLLVMPKNHMTQEDLWLSGATMGKVGEIAVDMGLRYCPGGYRILSNFGRDGLQSQEHGHVHVLGGMNLGPYA